MVILIKEYRKLQKMYMLLLKFVKNLVPAKFNIHKLTDSDSPTVTTFPVL